MRRKLTLRGCLLAGMLLLTAPTIQAEGVWYADLDYDVLDVRINSRSYYPHMLSLTAGRWLVEGIGVEAQIGDGTKSSSKERGTLEVTGLQSLAVRWQSPARHGMAAYILTGYGRLQLDGSVDAAPGYPGKEWFRGPVIGIGLHARSDNSRHLGMTLGYKHYFLEKELTTESVNLGLRYDF